MYTSLKELWEFSIVFLLFLSVYTILGKEWFAYEVQFDENWVRSDTGTFIDQNYNTFIEGFTTSFTILTGDNWCDIFYKHYRVDSNFWSALYFLSLKIIGEYILLLLLLAILIEKFDEDSINRIETSDAEE